jgi:hypothetical protein
MEFRAESLILSISAICRWSSSADPGILALLSS